MRNLLVAVDFSEVTSRVLDVAAELAGALGARVRLVHVAAPDPDFVGYEEDPPALRESHAAAYREEHRQLQGLADALRARGVEAKALLIRGPTVEKILEEAQRTQTELLVVGSHGRGALQRALLGSVSEGLLRRSDRPLLIVPSRLPRPPDPVGGGTADRGALP
jgi:nucleotide-binding universal stress UspA family protein